MREHAASRGGGPAVSFERMALRLLFVAFAVRAALVPAQDDTFWSLRAGADIWRTGRAPLVDAYSFTAAGAPWPDHEWLWQALLHACHHAGGMPLATAAGAAVILLGVWLVQRLTVGPPLRRFALLAAGLGLGSCVWALRPHLCTLLGLAALAWLLARGRAWPIPPLFWLWANVHGGVALGGLVLSAATAAAVARWQWQGAPEDRRRALALLAALPAAALATAGTPLGFGIFRFVWTSTARLQAAGITEWRPALPGDPVGAACWAAAGAFVTLLVWRRRALAAAPWATWALAAGALALLPPALHIVRNVAPFMMLAVPAASHILGHGGGGGGRSDHPRINVALLVGACAAAVAVVAVAYAGPARWLGWRPLSPAAVAAVRACPGPLYNRYNEGGQLIWAVPERRVFVDSRQDPYPLPFLLEAIAVEHGERPYRPVFDRWGIRCAFLPAGSPLAAVLGRDGWVTGFRDESWAILGAP
jgi:hypothetical protein